MTPPHSSLRPRAARRLLCALGLVVGALTALRFAGARPEGAPAPGAPGAPSAALPPAAPWPPERLAATGLLTDEAAFTLAADVHPFTPQYPLWTDGALKRRWIRLPPGAVIDASAPDAWQFPVGTRLWKEFAWERRVETRFLERRPDGSWLFASYVWSADGREAHLAPEGGVRDAYAIRPGLRHDVPARQDCLACHGGRATPVLGFSALQLSPDRDPLAPHAERPEPGSLDLVELGRRGWLRNADPAWATRPPRIQAASPRERAALGYLHGNCAACHAGSGDLAGLGLDLLARAGTSAPRVPPALSTTLGVPSRFRLPGRPADALPRIAPGDPRSSVLLARLSSRFPALQMPPLGTHAVDGQALALLEAWIRDDLALPTSPSLPTE